MTEDIVMLTPCSNCGRLLRPDELHFCIGAIPTTAGIPQVMPWKSEMGITGGQY